MTDLVHFLKLRENLHGHLVCSDELEICAGFLCGAINKKIADSDDTIAIHPSITAMFDNLYHWGGLGFENEKNMYVKTDDKYFRIGADRIKNKKAEKH